MVFKPHLPNFNYTLFIVTNGNKYAIITVTTQSFLPGTLVAIHSFLKTNTWFSGDIIVLANQIEPRFERFFMLFPRIKVTQISPEIIERTESVSHRFNQFQHRKAQFYSLDFARFTDYDKLLFFDSDVLFLKDLRELFDQQAPMLCIGDGFYYKGMLRDPKTYQEVKSADLKATQEVWTDNFNAGFMLFDGSLLKGNHHANLVKMIDTGLFGSVTTNHSDQLILNKYFKEDYQLISSIYNFRLGTADLMEEKDGATHETAKMIHFTSRRKPWENVHVLLTVPKFDKYLDYYLKWQEYWNDFLGDFDKLPPVEKTDHG